MKVRFNGGIKDVPLSEVTAANYMVPHNEVMFWHVLQEKIEYDRQTGKRLSRPVLQKYDTKSYPQTLKYLRDAGYTITVLHDPEQWAKAQAEAKAQAQTVAAAKSAAAKKAAEKAERAALKAELRKELLAELKAEAKKVNNKK